MIKPDDPRKLAEALLNRSVCAVRVGAVIADKHGIFSWGWNSMGSSGYGEHAEAAAIRRANPWRLRGATIYIAGKRARQVYSRPCMDCERLIRGYRIYTIIYTDGKGGWKEEEVY